jgi:putative endonuclease
LRSNIFLGRAGERQAVKFLKEKGYKILETNFSLKPLGEIDIIARFKNIICFIEVKTRRSLSYGAPYEAVDRRKQFRLSRLALAYLKSKK